MRRLLQILLLFLGLCGALFVAISASAQDVIVVRDVTVREGPASAAEKVHFPAVGERLKLLDDGRQERGYYHVRLTDGRTGWVFRTFVRREDEGASPAFTPGAPSGPNQITVHYIDVDQGNATLVEFPCAAILIDAGGRDPVAAGKLTRYLDAFFARRADLQNRFAAVFITHTHADHNTALGAVMYRYKAGGYVDNGRLSGSGANGALWMAAYVRDVTPPILRRIVLEKDVRAAGNRGMTDSIIDPVACPGVDPQIRVLTGGRERGDNPQWQDEDFNEGNNHSIVVRIDYGDASFLFPGDIENAGFEDMKARYAQSRMLDVGVYQVSHHGAENGTTDDFMRAISPQIAVISMGPESVRDQYSAFQYGHPRIKAVEAVRDAVTGTRPAKSVRVARGQRDFVSLPMSHAVYGTGWDGTVVVIADAQGRYSVRTER